jgi:hypothetical protein
MLNLRNTQVENGPVPSSFAPSHSQTREEMHSNRSQPCQAAMLPILLENNNTKKFVLFFG